MNIIEEQMVERRIEMSKLRGIAIGLMISLIIYSITHILPLGVRS